WAFCTSHISQLNSVSRTRSGVGRKPSMLAKGSWRRFQSPPIIRSWFFIFNLALPVSGQVLLREMQPYLQKSEQHCRAGHWLERHYMLHPDSTHLHHLAIQLS